MEDKNNNEVKLVLNDMDSGTPDYDSCDTVLLTPEMDEGSDTVIVDEPSSEAAPEVDEAQRSAAPVSVAHSVSASIAVPLSTAQSLSASVPAEQSVVSEPVEEASSEPENTEEQAPANVMDYTATLWKFVPVPEDVPEPSPEYLTSTIVYEGSRIIGARVRGKKHKHEGSCCDDWFETAALGDITFIVAADGAGSKKLSRIGSRESCRAAVGFLKRTFESNIVNDTKVMSGLSLEMSDPAFMTACKALADAVAMAIKQAYSAVESAFYCRAADKAIRDYVGRDTDVCDYSATLLLAVIVPLGNEKNEKLVVTCQIGDGMIALINTKSEFASCIKLMGDAESGDFSGETEFLTSERMRRPESIALKTKISRGSSDILMLMTDGVSDDYFPNDTQLTRLYFDMVANGILSPREAAENDDTSWLDKLPKPVEYPWVNDKSVMVGLNYTNKLCAETGLTPEQLWEQPKVLTTAAARLGELAPDAGERLKIWLDNYVSRGSFDDRTMVIALI